MFKIGDIVKGKRSGNVIEVLEDQKNERVFTGIVIEVGVGSREIKVGHTSEDWYAGAFELIDGLFWKV